MVNNAILEEILHDLYFTRGLTNEIPAYVLDQAISQATRRTDIGQLTRVKKSMLSVHMIKFDGRYYSIGDYGLKLLDITPKFKEGAD